MEKKKWIHWFTAVFLFTAVGMFGQTNEMVDEILSQKQLLAGHGAYIVLVSQDLVSEDATPQQALDFLQGLPVGKRFSSTRVSDPMTLGEFSYVLQEVQGIPKGLFSSMFSGPRYAVRDLRFLGIIQSRGTAGMDVSGERALRILTRALGDREDRL